MARRPDSWFRAFAPASIANFGSGFDLFAAAIGRVDSKPGRHHRFRPYGDIVSVRRTNSPGVRVLSIFGDGGRLPHSARKNCAAVAAAALLRLTKAAFGLELVLEKGLPLSSGLGSSAASAAAGAYAAALAAGGNIDREILLESSLAGEHVADDSWHGDNVWASLSGGGVLVPSTRPVEVIPLGAPRGLELLVTHPDFELETRRAREVIASRVALSEALAQSGRFASFVMAWKKGDVPSIGRGLADRLAEPFRAPLVPGFPEAQRSAMGEGAYGLTFAGAGPSVVAIVPPDRAKRVARVIETAFRRAGLDSTSLLCRVDPRGAREVKSRLNAGGGRPLEPSRKTGQAS